MNNDKSVERPHADYRQIEARVLAHWKDDASRTQRIRSLLAALPPNASNAQRLRAFERIREIAGSDYPKGARTGRLPNDAERVL